MNKKKIQLRIAAVSNSHVQVGAYILTLAEIVGTRQLRIAIAANEAQLITILLKGIKPPRPLTHELFSAVLGALNVELMRVVIYNESKGVYHAYIYLKTENNIMRVDARTSDAVILATHMNAPIFIYESIFEAGCVQTDPLHPDEATTAKTSTKTTLKTLIKELQDAIDKEEYERAAQLHHQINQYKKDQ